MNQLSRGPSQNFHQIIHHLFLDEASQQKHIKHFFTFVFICIFTNSLPKLYIFKVVLSKMSLITKDSF